MKVLTLFILLLMETSFNADAIAQVRSKSFSLVLKTILSHNVPEISVPDAAGNFNKYVFIDTREFEEYNVSHLQNAVYAGYEKFEITALTNIRKEQPIVVYCSIGKRSEKITGKLIKMGYKNIYNLYGGIFEWVNQGNKVYDMKGKLTENIHPYNWLWGKWIERGNKVY